jgi:hypothetical protein
MQIARPFPRLAFVLLALLLCGSLRADPTDPNRVRRAHVWLGPTDGVVDFEGDVKIDDARRKIIAGWIDEDAAAVTPPAVVIPPVVVPATSPDEPALTDGATRTFVHKGEAIPSLGNGDHLLLERGGAWTGTIDLQASNAYIGAFGDGPAPRIVAPNGSNGIQLQKPTAGNVIADLEIVSKGGTADDFDPKRADADGIGVYERFDGLTLRRVTVRGFAYGLCLEHRTSKTRSRGLVAQDCRFIDNWSIDTRKDGAGSPVGLYKGQGAYLALLDGARFTNCTFDRNGPPPVAVPNAPDWSGFRHGVYAQGVWPPDDWSARNVVIDRCFASRCGWNAFELRGDGSQVSNSVTLGMPGGTLLNSQSPVAFTDNVVLLAGRAKWYGNYGGGLALGVSAPAGDVSRNLFWLVAPPANPNERMPIIDFGQRKDAWAHRGGNAATGAGNVAIGWGAATRFWGNKGQIPAVTMKPAMAIDQTYLDGLVSQARAGTLDLNAAANELRHRGGVK